VIYSQLEKPSRVAEMSNELDLLQIMQQFPDEKTAREFLETIRWPGGPVCPHCGGVDVYKLTPKTGSKQPGRKGLYKCKYCRRQFTVTVGTVFESSHIAVDKWLIAIYLMCSSKKGVSAHQIHRMLGLTYKTAWFMCHRIRYAMDQPPLLHNLNGIIEAEETYVGGKARGKRGRGANNKTPVFSLVERGGRISSQPVAGVTAITSGKALRE
jgi:transposase-like protein